MKMSQVDLFKGDKLTEKFCSFSVNEPLNSHFKENDMESMNFLLSIGSILIPIYVYMCSMTFISYIIFIISMKCYK